MSKLKFNLHEWEKEKMDELVREETKRIEREEGFNAGVEQNTIEVIKNMLENNAELEFISKVTGKTIEEIEKIQNNL